MDSDWSVFSKTIRTIEEKISLLGEVRSEHERAKNHGRFSAARPQSMIYYFILDSKITMVVRLYSQIQSYKLIYNSKRKRLGILSACRDRAS